MTLQRLVPLVAASGLLGVLGCNSPVSIGEQTSDTEQATTSGGGTTGGASTPSSATGPSASGQATTNATATATTTAAASGTQDDSNSGEDTDGTTGALTDATGSAESEGTADRTTGFAGDGLVLFVNFEGPSLSSGADDATIDSTQISQLAIDLEPYPGSATDRAEILAEVEEDFAGINVTITDERPADGEYTMAVVTPSSPFAGSGGIAPLDCGNAQPSNVVAVFTAPQGTELSTAVIGATVSREVGFALGLETVDSKVALMSGSFIVGTAFVDECTPNSDAPGCPHIGCNAGSQNSHAELQARANE